MNERDSEAVSAMLQNRGYAIVNTEKDADIVLLNTCSVRDQAEQKAIGKAANVGSKNRKDKNFILGIMGCMAQNRGMELIDKLPDIDLLVGTQKFHQIPNHLDNIKATLLGQGVKPSTIVDLDEEKDSQNTIKAHISEKTKVSAFISIMQGCNMNCSFCIVPKTRGPERHRPIEDIMDEIEQLAVGGTKEVTLLGQIVTSYGQGIVTRKNGKSPFVQLLERVQDIKGIERIRFTSPHPRGFKEDLIEAYRDLSKLCEYVHLPMQSASNSILKVMKRPYTIEQYLKIVEGLRNVVPGMYFSTDIIVGFPGESKEDFEMTRSVFDEIAFDMAYIFKYSVRSGTPAEVLPDHISDEEKEARNQALLEILEKHSKKRNESLVGTKQEILVEGPAKKGDNMFMGRNRGYRKIIFPGNERMIGNLIDIKIESATVSTLIGSADILNVENSNT
jgi:tRNA-2-methylthio-N6-dimethylallyladenosine synthase